MEKVILRRCCGNCEWSISPECEEDIMHENSYEEDDPTRPRSGDCCLGREHDGNYFCDSHDYISSALETYTFYEEKFLGPGYFIVTEYKENVIKFLKLYRNGTYDNYNYGIVVYEYDPVKKVLCTGITYEISRSDNELLYMAISIFAKALGYNVIYDIDNKGFMSLNTYEHSTSLYFTGGKDSNFINIKINNDKEDRIYKLIENLYRNMSVITMNKANSEIYGKVRKITKNI